MKSYPVEIGGKTRNIRYDFNALCDLEEVTGKSISELTGLSSIRALLWAGLKWETKGVTQPMVGMWIEEHLRDGGKVDDLLDNAIKALSASGIMKQASDLQEDQTPGE